ncbi:MAG: class I SAM-dependent methyltransferase [Desertimonas sp.]
MGEGLAAGPSTFSFLDLGGGHGAFADRVLAAFPDASAVGGDTGTPLRDRNRPHPNKTVREIDATRLADAEVDRQDVVFLNWVLHHLVVTGDYHRTRQTIVRALTDVRWRLRPGGRVSVYENLYEGPLGVNLPGRLIFGLTSMRVLAPLTGRLGANTAGVGVCFHSERAWRKIFEDAGYEVVVATPRRPWSVAWWKRLGLGVSSVRAGHFWLSPR